MTPAIKRSLKRAFSSTLVWPFVGRRLRPGLLVLAYHRVGPPDGPFRKVDVASFRAQMAWLRRHCSIIGPDVLDEALDTPGACGRISVLVTFDDGYRDYSEYAYPVLQSLDIPAVNFIATRYIDDGSMFWWDLVDLACQRTPLRRATVPWSVPPFDLGSARGRMQLYRECQRHLKRIPDDAREALVPALLAALELDAGELTVARQVMTWDQVRATAERTTYGGHLHTHPLVSRIDDSRLEDELRISQDRLVRELGRRTPVFAFPDGDITDPAKQALRRHGYEFAFGITGGFARPGGDRMAIPRLPGPATVGDLAWRLARLSRTA